MVLEGVEVRRSDVADADTVALRVERSSAYHLRVLRLTHHLHHVRDRLVVSFLLQFVALALLGESVAHLTVEVLLRERRAHFVHFFELFLIVGRAYGHLVSFVLQKVVHHKGNLVYLVNLESQVLAVGYTVSRLPVLYKGEHG